MGLTKSFKDMNLFCRDTHFCEKFSVSPIRRGEIRAGEVRAGKLQRANFEQSDFRERTSGQSGNGR